MNEEQVKREERIERRARLLQKAMPGLALQLARRRAIDEVTMFDHEVDVNTRSGAIHAVAVAKIKQHPGLEYRDAVFAAAAQLRDMGCLPRHESGVL